MHVFSQRIIFSCPCDVIDFIIYKQENLSKNRGFENIIKFSYSELKNFFQKTPADFLVKKDLQVILAFIWPNQSFNIKTILDFYVHWKIAQKAKTHLQTVIYNGKLTENYFPTRVNLYV